MARTLCEMSVEEVESLIERSVDSRMQVWLTHIMDALAGPDDEDKAELRPEFAAALRRSMDEADRQEVLDLETFRA